MRAPVTFNGGLPPGGYQVAPGSLLPAPGSPATAAAQQSNEQPRTLLYQKIIVAANSTLPVVASGNYVYVEAVVYDTFASYNFGYAATAPTIKPDTSQATVSVTEASREIGFAVPFTKLQITNPNLFGAVVLTLWIGYGSVRRDTLRSVKDFAVGGLFTNIAYAANKTVGAGPLVYPEVCSPINQRARIKKATMAIDGSAVTTNADFTLWLTPEVPLASTNNSTFQLSQNFPNGFGYTLPTQIRFPSFVTGGAGSNGAICELSGLDIEVFSKYSSNYGFDYLFTLFGILVCNGAWTPGATGALRTYLTFEQE